MVSLILFIFQLQGLVKHCATRGARKLGFTSVASTSAAYAAASATACPRGLTATNPSAPATEICLTPRANLSALEQPHLHFTFV